MSIRNIRTNYLSDKATFGNSTMPIGAIVPIFKADDEKVTDNGVVTGIGTVSTGSSTGTGYTNDIISGVPTGPISAELAPANFGVDNDLITLNNHPFVDGDKLVVTESAQNPNKLKLGASIQTITVNNGGSGYTTPPNVIVTDNGAGPAVPGQFSATINSGVVTAINVVDGGQGYQNPVVTISGGGGAGAIATPNLSAGGTGGVQFEKNFSFYVDKVDNNNFRIARSNSDINDGKFYNVTDIGSAGNFTVASSTGYGLEVGVFTNLDSTINYCTIINPGYGYTDGETVYVLQNGSDGLARIEIISTTSNTATDPALQYPGFLYCDGAEYNASDYPLLFEVITDDYGGNGGTFSKENFGTTPGTTFKVPDYKTKKLVGAGGGVSGAGSPVSGNVISVVGATGGRWYFSKDEQENLFDIGNIIISGYTNVTEFVGGSLSGEVTIQVGPLQEKMISAVPEHEHAILTSSAPQAGAFEGGGGPVDDHAVGFKDSNGQVNFFLPSGGVPLFHAHGIVDYVIQDPNLSTFGNVGGIGEKFFATFTQSQINAGGVFNVPSHDLNTGNMIRVVSNSQSTQLSFSVNGVSVNFSPQSIWWVIKVDDDNFLLAGSKYLALKATPLIITNGGSSGEITIETGYQIAGNLPAEVIKIITTPSPTTWDINDNYTIGGKTVQLPGDTTTNLSIKVSKNSNGTYTVPAPAADEVPILAIGGNLTGAGGSGGNTANTGGNGGNTTYTFSYAGNTYAVRAGGGGGGQSGNGGGSGGSGGNVRYGVNGSFTTVNGNGTFNLAGGVSLELSGYTAGQNGTNGGSSAGGTGGSSTLFYGKGGDGVADTSTEDVQTYTEFSYVGTSFQTYNIPSGGSLKSVTCQVRGGGGGAGGVTNGSHKGGKGGAGKRVNAELQTGNSGVLRVYVGNGGQAGSGNSGGAAGPSPYVGGGGGGSGNGAGGGGGGGGASAVGTSSAILVGAGGGGGGGSGGNSSSVGSDQNGQPNNTDGVQNLSSIFAGSGGGGGNGVCSGGGGGGGGGGAGVGSGIGGGGGGSNGSNARRAGYGAKRGQSAVKSSGTGPTVSSSSSSGAGNGGNNPAGNSQAGGAGSVSFTATNTITTQGAGGGGGGSGATVYFKFEASGLTNPNASTLQVGNNGSGGGASGQDGGGEVGYYIEESIGGGTGTSTTSGLFDLASTTVDYIESGTGSGSAGGFTSTDNEKYLRFFGSEAVRWARTITINASPSNPKQSPIINSKWRVIRGNGSNGGETPGEPLELFASNDNGSSYTKIGTISSASGPTTWTIVDIAIPSDFQTNNLLLEVRQVRSSSGNAGGDNFGIDWVQFEYDEAEVEIATYPQGRADLGIEFVTERIEPQGDPINSAGLDVNEGTFTLSSAVKLNVSSTLSPEIDIPLLTRYHLVKYLIRAY